MNILATLFLYCQSHLIFIVAICATLIIQIKPTHTRHPVSIFEKILVFSLTTSTKKNGSGATLGTLGEEKLKFTKKN